MENYNLSGFLMLIIIFRSVFMPIYATNQSNKNDKILSYLKGTKNWIQNNKFVSIFLGSISAIAFAEGIWILKLNKNSKHNNVNNTLPANIHQVIRSIRNDQFLGAMPMRPFELALSKKGERNRELQKYSKKLQDYYKVFFEGSSDFGLKYGQGNYMTSSLLVYDCPGDFVLVESLQTLRNSGNTNDSLFQRFDFYSADFLDKEAKKLT